MSSTGLSATAISSWGCLIETESNFVICHRLPAVSRRRPVTQICRRGSEIASQVGILGQECGHVPLKIGQKFWGSSAPDQLIAKTNQLISERQKPDIRDTS